ncbi:hypothetical protein ZIOFF_074478 (mitochondrion) [Zingiber officinale]|uniref:Large ribosomal subunit protein uL2m n=1 Tax=Zingiber officinale TaxID=94328 RepID=A0A8J5BWT3_ZINOF|nr:hypothetical protein ZIOFF_075502 [Zingiber officinale]KAG6467678.1 hypothetical protein ZIOFF_074478 [Zingiber officinale]
MNCDGSKPSKSGFLRPAQNAHTYLRFQDLVRTANKGRVEGGSQLAASWPRPPAFRYEILDRNSQVGNSIPLADIRMGTWVHDIECHPGQGAKLARAAGTYAQIIKEPAPQCEVQLPSGVEKVIDSRCRATIGIVSHPNHGARKLRKAGQSRWLGRGPIVRGVAMNPVDHPHGGGEGRTKGGRPSVSPWGKPTKAGFRAAASITSFLGQSLSIPFEYVAAYFSKCPDVSLYSDHDTALYWILAFGLPPPRGWNNTEFTTRSGQQS